MNIDKMTDEEVKDELDRRGIDPGASYWKTRSEIYARNFEESQNILKATNAALEEWKRLAGVYEQEACVLDSNLRDQMEITGRKEMELTKLRGEMRRMQQNIERPVEIKQEGDCTPAGEFEDWVRSKTGWSTDSRNGVYLDIRTAHAFIAWESKRRYELDIIEIKEKVARLEEQLLLSDYHKEGKGAF